MGQGNVDLPWCLRTLEVKVKNFLLTEAGRHLLNSRKELLLAIRALIDQKIDWVDRLGREPAGKNVKVE